VVVPSVGDAVSTGRGARWDINGVRLTPPSRVGAGRIGRDSPRVCSARAVGWVAGQPEPRYRYLYLCESVFRTKIASTGRAYPAGLRSAYRPLRPARSVSAKAGFDLAGDHLLAVRRHPADLGRLEDAAIGGGAF
jgi:hypothetical protein